MTYLRLPPLQDYKNQFLPCVSLVLTGSPPPLPPHLTLRFLWNLFLCKMWGMDPPSFLYMANIFFLIWNVTFTLFCILFCFWWERPSGYTVFSWLKVLFKVFVDSEAILNIRFNFLRVVVSSLGQWFLNSWGACLSGSSGPFRAWQVLLLYTAVTEGDVSRSCVVGQVVFNHWSRDFPLEGNLYFIQSHKTHLLPEAHLVIPGLLL